MTRTRPWRGHGRRFKFGDDTLVGYQGNVCKVRDVYMWAVLGTTDTTPRWLDIWPTLLGRGLGIGGTIQPGRSI